MLTDYLDSFDVADRVRNKRRSTFDDWAIQFISHTSLMFMATSDQHGCLSVSPRGGEPGFLKVVSDRSMAFWDTTGNNLFESYRNLSNSSTVGLILLIPGIEETLRMQGKASVQGPTAQETPHGSTGLQVTFDIDTWYYHCGKSLRTGGVWDVNRIQENKNNRPIPKRPPFACSDRNAESK